ncbi:Imm1 family immunity protein [Streptomyces sp. MBT84]|uniref:Imm1 family immunity protein n=1 Tax=Streptomyces sp. MBT84 TaxID=1488414 RepID=UPI0027E1208F|nr:Imm1 family immunity protein [Streptomyces sp. MBT84]
MEMSALIAHVLGNLRGEKTDQGWVSAGDDAVFSLTPARYTNDTFDWWPDNYLHVAANPSNGYGGLIWYVTGERAKKAQDEISAHTWVSNNPEPPKFDPRVVRDPSYPRFHDPRSVIPTPLVRRALQEFCEVGTGDRPKCIEWALSDAHGARFD